ncbi:MAG: hypothetical protein IIA45_15385 [Bacteroidetes bacterium]|nr:hypothetical protein [Bacteroidota bacterium]
MKTIFTLITLFAFTTMSFEYNSDPKEDSINTGTYGIGDEAYSTVALTINEDYTFRYINNSDSKNPVDVKGNWILNGNVVELNNYDSDQVFPDKWKIVGNQMCVKSKGFKNFQVVRLCLID